ncbi:MAG: hypothetical protein O4861_04095 [Trichodesmium sp. St16_bin4-tuft]|nr:hypothetical protein [Trichodesmium sp. St4_bin8_1]MDE5073535.1 hypothetical protein [Trichodesmium sp. St5_bin8]MDE5092666.1 hypothetical protein [Trichodesmium sp. St18_bin3_1_1]MDE5092964.1 hypothetical protein [Trichodesmium sp. St11_bin5]MDE5097561.1 hypothetical protein [Trichodesmium sp. St16_bin4-tuft]MDE5104684.1 hypothetical protein [Trichodesmium sp. St19_bin2]MDT9338417.1 hypothetical protein [Trichodesmium erythraeum 21-75]
MGNTGEFSDRLYPNLDIFLSDGFQAKRKVNLSGATLRGQLCCS